MRRGWAVEDTAATVMERKRRSVNKGVATDTSWWRGSHPEE